MRISDWSSDVCSSDLFKPGGFDLTRLPNFNNFEFDAERNTNYEIGLKGNVLDRKLRFSAALFWTDYSDFQAQAFDGLNLVTRNAELFRIKEIGRASCRERVCQYV